MDKATFCEKLCELLQSTDMYSDLMELKYSKELNGDELVTPMWLDKHYDRVYEGQKIDVTADSNIAIIKDVLRWID